MKYLRGVLNLLAVACAWSLQAERIAEYELPPIEYSTSAASNAISGLQEKLDADRDQLAAMAGRELLTSILSRLEVPVESQVLVFSRTSLQRKRIDPEHPRAIYFSDDCYVGWVPGGLMEAAVTDPNLGIVFYQLDPEQRKQELRFERNAECLSCHGGSMTRDWPGLMVRSVFPDRRGEPILSAGTFLVEHDTPLSERWGGWYVTGDHGTARHMGNVTAAERTGEPNLDRDAGANVTDLSKFFDVTKYPRSDSDIVALMVLEHQVGMHNRLCKASLRARKWINYQRQLQKELGETVTDEPTGTALLVIRNEAKAIVEHLLYRGEIELPDNGIDGSEEFRRAFAANRRPDSRGRSLKDFDLKEHLFKFRCSYMIYSRAFDSLPQPLKNEIYDRLYAILTSSEPEPDFKYLSDAERNQIAEILTSTKPDLAHHWRRLSNR